MSKVDILPRMEKESRSEQDIDSARVGALLFTTAAEGLVVVDVKGRIRMHNPRLNELFGYNEGELKGRSVDELLPNALRDRHTVHRATYTKHPVRRSMGISLGLLGQRKNGTVFPVEVSLNHFSVDGTLYVMGLVSDITLRRKAEEALHRTNQELEERVEKRTAELRAAERSVRKALEKERELHQLKSRFVSMASHEFRTPLSTIMSSIDLIGRYTDGQEKVEKHVIRIRNKVRELTAMLNEFLSLERIEQGHVQMSPVEVDIVDRCIELIEELRGLAKPGQTIDYDHAGQERRVTTDSQMIGQVITNLVSNAVKYSPEDASISIRTNIQNGVLDIVVRDQGMGITKEDQQHLFERFFRGSNVMTIQGTGLGLNIVKRYLELMKGTISYSSEPGNTVFRVTLPQHVPAPTNEPTNG